MKRFSHLALFVGLFCAPAFGASVLFTPVGVPSAVPGDPVQFDLTLSLDGFGSFDFVNILIGSDDVADIGFTFDSNWFAMMPDGAPGPIFDPDTLGFFTQELEIDGSSASPLAVTSLPLGTLTLDTTGMAPADYSFGVQVGVSEVVWTAGEGGASAPITGSAAFTITPEPGTLVLLLMGAATIRRRR